MWIICLYAIFQNVVCCNYYLAYRAKKLDQIIDEMSEHLLPNASTNEWPESTEE